MVVETWGNLGTEVVCSMAQTLVEQRRPLAANLRRSIAALREKYEKEQSSTPSYGSTVT